MSKDKETWNSLVEGKVIYLLGLVTVVQTVYPITANNTIVSTLVYQLLYASLVVVGVLVARSTPRDTILLIITGITWLVGGPVYAFNQGEVWALLFAYVTLMVFQVMVIRVLLLYIFTTARIGRDVIYAASAVYLLLGAIFVSAFGLLETLAPGSFVDSTVASGEVFPWQHFIYYSYATLTTLGYGDILPVTMWARSLASVEAIVGVLYVTVIMARLVGLYSTGNENGRNPL